jgi:hypothetical protein
MQAVCRIPPKFETKEKRGVPRGQALTSTLGGASSWLRRDARRRWETRISTKTGTCFLRRSSTRRGD